MFELGAVAHQSVVQGFGQLGEVEPDVERGDGRDLDLEAHPLQPVQDVVALHQEVLLEGHALLGDVFGIEEG